MGELTDELQAKARELGPAVAVVSFRALLSRWPSPLRCHTVCWLRALATLVWVRRPELRWGSARCATELSLQPPLTCPLPMGDQSPGWRGGINRELISSVFSLPSVSSTMVSWKGHRPGGAGWSASCLTPDTLGANCILPPGLSLLTSEMGIIYRPVGLLYEFLGIGRTREVGTAKARWPWARRVCFRQRAPRLLGRQRRGPRHPAPR